MEPDELLIHFERMLADVCPPAAVRQIESGESAASMWDEFATSGFLDALVGENRGGAGLSFAEVGPLIRSLGRFAVPLPVAETMAVRALLADAGVPCPDGPIALASAPAAGKVIQGARTADHILFDDGNVFHLHSLEDLALAATGVPGDLAMRLLQVPDASSRPVTRPADGLRPLAAVIRAALIAGAAGRLLDMTAGYANERVQFGKPIGRQQALQQTLAVMAEDVVATRIAAELGASSGFPPAVAAAATAKSVASSAAVRIAATAHAVHGAIGISAEHDLQLYTRRLHAWRFADGSEGYWDEVLGGLRLASVSPSVDWIRRQVMA